MDVRHLQLLRELAERGSITAVAHASHRTASAVSQQLRTATREAGMQLVEPAGRGIRLTEAGRLLAAGGAEVETVLAAVQARWDEYRKDPGGTVSVLAFPSAAAWLFPPVLAAAEAAGIRLVLSDDDVPAEEFAARTADHDIVIGHSLHRVRAPGRMESRRQGRRENRQLNGTASRQQNSTESRQQSRAQPTGRPPLVIRDLAVEPLDVAMASGHRLATRTSLRAADLADASWIGVPPGFPFDTVLTDISATLGTAPQIVQRVRDNRLVEALVRSSEHLALLPRFTTPHRSGLRLLPLEDVPAHRYLTALMRPDRAERRAVRTVLDALIDVATAEAAADEDAGLGEGERALRP